MRAAIEAGRIDSTEAAVHEAFALWEERERAAALAEFRETLDAAEASLVRGEGLAIQSGEDLAADVKRRGRARAAEKQAQS